MITSHSKDSTMWRSGLYNEEVDLKTAILNTKNGDQFSDSKKSLLRILIRQTLLSYTTTSHGFDSTKGKDEESFLEVGNLKHKEPRFLHPFQDCKENQL